MTLTQLEYIVAVANEQHFAKAAAQCFVTQPTLSMQIQKLEEEIGIKIFDRNKQPVLPTEAGVEIIAQARKILAERDAFHDIIQVQKGVLQGQLTVGVIPTLAPYLMPCLCTKRPCGKNGPLLLLFMGARLEPGLPRTWRRTVPAGNWCWKHPTTALMPWPAIISPSTR